VATEEKVLRCDCGFEVRTCDVADLVSRVRAHAFVAHGMTLSAQQVLDLAARAMPTVERGGERS
jgi:predicted small metal-binding protein